MNIDVKEIIPILLKAVAWLRKHVVVISIVIVAVMYASLIIQINILNKRQPTDTAINERIQNIKQLKIDQKTAENLKKLENNSAEVKSLFEAARENPFQE